MSFWLYKLNIYYNTMRDQEIQILQGFQRNYKQFHLKMKLHSQQKLLQINIQNTISLSRYSQIIDQEYITSQQNFKNLFDIPFDLFDYLIHHFQDVEIQDGFITFGYVSGIMRKKIKKIQIKVIKEQIDPLEFAQLKIDKMKNEMREKDSLIFQLKDQLQMVNYQRKKLTERLENEQKRNQQLAQALLQQKQNNQELKQRFDGKVDDLNHDLKMTEDVNIKLSNQLQQLKNIIYSHQLKELIKEHQEPKLQQKNCIEHHPNNSHHIYYNIDFIQGSSIVKITRKAQSGNFNFINKYSIQPNQKVKYSIKLNKVTYNTLMIGFCTKKGVGKKNNHNNSQSVYYYCYSSGFIYEGGFCRSINVASGAGDVIDCVADLSNSKLGWYKKGILFGESIVPISMKNKSLHFSMILYYQGDEVDLSI